MTSRQVGQFLLVFVSTISIDQISKYFAKDVIINTGVSFGLFPSSLLTVVLIGVLLALAFKFGRDFYSINPSVTGIFFGGSISNIIDRLLYGGVRDFLPVPLIAVRNNLADWGIILSLLWIFWNLNKASSSKMTRS